MRLFKLICALLALVLMLPGQVAAAETAQSAMGRYVEVPLSYPGSEQAYFAQVDGTTYAVNGSGDALYVSRDMVNWDQSTTGHDEQQIPALGGVNRIAVGADGSLYLASGWAMKDEQGHPLIERIREGAAEKVALDRKLPWNTDGIELLALPSGELLALSTEAAYLFTQDGATQQKYAVTGGDALAVFGNEMAVSSHRNGIISIIDLETGHEIRTLELPTSASYGLINYDADGALHYVCTDGIYRVNAGGTLMVQIVDGRLTTLGKPSAYAWQLLFDSDNNPVISYKDYQSNGMSLIAYRYDESVATEPNTALSVFALYDTKTLRQCAAQFQKENPEVLVDITIGLPEGTAITRDDAIRTLNTELLAGKGPDVLVLDGLPVKSYIDKGVLKDLCQLVQPMIDQGLLTENLAGAYRGQDGSIPAVPTRFLLPSVWGEIDGLDTLEDLADWSEANPDALPYYAIEPETLIGTFYLSCAPAWFTGGRLDEAKVEVFLAAMKSIRGKWSHEAFAQKTGWDIRAMMKEMGMEMPKWNPYVSIGGGSNMEENNGISFLVEGTQKQLPYLLRGPDTVSMPNGALTSLKSGSFAALPGQVEGCFVPMLLMGAGKNGERGELAERFIAAALGEEVQNTDLMEGFPVNVKALDAAQARKDTPFIISAGAWSSEWPDQAGRDKLRAIIDGLKTPVIPDFTLYQMIVDESAPFFEGQIDAKQAAQNVCAKANAYLSE